MKHSSILFTIGSGILVLGLLLSVFIPQAVVLDADQRRLALDSVEVAKLQHFSEKDEMLSGIYIIRIIDYKQNDLLALKILDPDEILIKDDKMSTVFLIDTFPTLKEGDYSLHIENPTERTIEISAWFGHSALGPSSQVLSLVLPSLAIVSGVGLLVGGTVFYYREKKR